MSYDIACMVLQLTTQQQVCQVYPPILTAQSSAYPGQQQAQQQAQQQLVQQQLAQQQQGSYPSNQVPRYQQSGPQFFSSQRKHLLKPKP